MDYGTPAWLIGIIEPTDPLTLAKVIPVPVLDSGIYYTGNALAEVDEGKLIWVHTPRGGSNLQTVYLIDVGAETVTLADSHDFGLGAPTGYECRLLGYDSDEHPWFVAWYDLPTDKFIVFRVNKTTHLIDVEHHMPDFGPVTKQYFNGGFNPADGMIWMVNTFNGYFWKVHPVTGYVNSWPFSHFQYAHDVWIDAPNRLLVSGYQPTTDIPTVSEYDISTEPPTLVRDYIPPSPTNGGECGQIIKGVDGNIYAPFSDWDEIVAGLMKFVPGTVDPVVEIPITPLPNYPYMLWGTGNFRYTPLPPAPP
jgi:hypothetical protein